MVLKKDAFSRLKYWTAKNNLVMKGYSLVGKLGLGKLALLLPESAKRTGLNSFFSYSDIDWSKTRAYALGSFGQIFLNIKGREPQGIVESAEVLALKKEITSKLKQLKNPLTDKLLKVETFDPNKVYQGPYVGKAADILFKIENYLFQTSNQFGWQANGFFGESEYTDSGSHRDWGIFAVRGPKIKKGVCIEEVNILDVAPTILKLFGQKVSVSYDGRILEELWI